MNFLAQQQAVADNLGLSLAIAAQATQIKRYINQAQKVVLLAHDWPFLRAPNPYVIQTVPDATSTSLAVTVTTVASSTTATFSGTIATSMVGRYLQTSSSKDWYRITAHTAGTATMTLEIAAISALSAGTFTIRKFFYSLNPSPSLDRIIGVRQSITPFSLLEMSKTVFDDLRPDPTTTGTPKMYLVAGKDSTGLWQISFWPVPDSVINMTVEYLVEPSDLSADADVSIIPEKWRATVVLEGASAYGYKSLDDDRYTATWNVFMQGIQAMQLELNPSTNKTRIMRSVDQPVNLRPIPFPENYPLVR